MAEIKDTGTVWIRGQVGTSFAIRVDDVIFVPGKEDSHTIDYWLEDGNLCVDLHDSQNKVRFARKFSFDLKPRHPAALFNGFKQTKHDDTAVVLFDDEGVMSKSVSGTEYDENRIASKSPRDFWEGLDWS